LGNDGENGQETHMHRKTLWNTNTDTQGDATYYAIRLQHRRIHCRPFRTITLHIGLTDEQTRVIVRRQHRWARKV